MITKNRIQSSLRRSPYLVTLTKVNHMKKMMVLAIFASLSFNLFAQLQIDGTQSMPSPVTFSALTTAEKNSAKNGIVVHPGEELTMDVALVINGGKSIIVNAGSAGTPGGILNVASTISTSTLTSTWTGIVVTGVAGASHFTTDPDPTLTNDQAAYYGVLNTEHGRVSLKQGCIIERALHGVESNDGGIVESMDITTASLNSATGPHFFNCREGIYIGNYTQGDYSANRLNGINFEWNSFAAYHGTGLTDYSTFFHVFLENAGGTYLGGCKFKNFDTWQYNSTGRGVGVFSKSTNGQDNPLVIAEAGDVFAIDPATGCTIVKVYNNSASTFGGEFDYLSNGVQVTISGKISISDQEMSHDYDHIQILGAEHVNIKSNNLYTNEVTLSTYFNSLGSSFTFLSYMGHISLTSCNHVLVYDNIVETAKTDKTTVSYPAVHIKSAKGGKILIQKNDFESDVSNSSATACPVGVSAAGHLDNFEWICNKFEDWDVDVSYSSTFSGGGVGPSAVPVSAAVAGNTYSAIATTNIKNNTSTMLTYKHNLATPPSVSGPITLIYDPTTRTWEGGDCDLTCSDIETIFDPDNLAVVNLDFNNLMLYPNPTSGMVNFDFDALKHNTAYVKVYDLKGMLIKEKTLKDHYQMDLSDLINGLYIIKLTSKDNVYTGRVHVRH